MNDARTYSKNVPEDRGVVHSRTVPTMVAELILTLIDPIVRTLAYELHMRVVFLTK